MSNKSICPMAFNALDIEPHGEIKPCCIFMNKPDEPTMNISDTSISEFWHSEFMQDIRTRMLSGDTIEQCRICYDEEDTTGHSKRIRELDNLVDHSVYEDPQIQRLDVKLGNTCNLKCQICNDHSSSLFNSENARIKNSGGADAEYAHNRPTFNTLNDTLQMKWPTRPEIWDDILDNHIQGIRMIDFMGGEPLLDKSHHAFMQRIPQHIRDNISVSYVTNGTQLPDFELLSKFKDHHITVSADGVGQRFEFNRFPAKWDKVQNNILTMQQHGSLLISYSVSAYSLMGIPEALDWYASHNIRVWMNYVHYPHIACCRILPDEVKQQFRDLVAREYNPDWKQVCGVDIQAVLDFMMGPADPGHSMTDTIRHLEIRDRVRNTNYLDSLPEFKNVR